ncbi:MAG TPA: hypothetical protein VH518_25375 [Tepidisphaeraceae bacterium]|jgi:hypothetical protein
MRGWRNPSFIIIVLVTVANCSLLPRATRAVVLVRSADRNVTPPNGSLLNSGWQWQGQWRDFLGTAISTHYFVTAEHVGGTVGENFILNGVSYKTIATYDDPLTDLQVWRIAGSFPTWAPLYKKTAEAERGAVIYGRGTQRGDAVIVNNQLKGWLWGDDDHVQSWGTNLLVGPVSGMNDNGTAVSGTRIYWKFDRVGQAQEAAVTNGDSGGGVFIRDSGVWKLAGVNFGVQSEFTFPGSTDVKNGALMDVGGLDMSDGTPIPDTVRDNPTRGYATRISDRVPWIFDVINGKVPPAAVATPGPGVPEPGSFALLGAAVLLWHGFSTRAWERRRSVHSNLGAKRTG